MTTKKVIAAVFFALLSFALTSCSAGSSDETQYYYWEAFIVSKADFNSVPPPSSSGATFDELYNFRNQMKKYSVKFISSNTNETRESIYKFLTEQAATANEANKALNTLNERGNLIATFVGISYGDDYLAFDYWEKIK